MTSTTDRAVWLAERRNGIGASDAPALVGLSRYASPFSVWASKVYGDDDTQPVSEPARWGLKLEQVVIEAFEEESGLHVEGRQVAVTHPTIPWMKATLDGWVTDGDTIHGVYEGKTASPYAHDWGDLAAGDMPPAVHIQVQHQLAVTNLGVAYVAVLIGGQQFRWGTVERDDQMIADLIQIETEFWELVETRTPPDVDGLPATTDAVNRLTRNATNSGVELLEAGVAAVERYRDAAAAMKIAEEDKERARNMLALLLATSEVGLVDGKTVVTYRAPSGKGRVDLAALEHDHPQIVAAYRQPSTTRVLRVASRGAR